MNKINEYKEMFSKMHSNTEVNLSDYKKKSRFTKKKIAMIVAVATLAVGTMSVAATTYMKWSQGLSELTHVTEKQKIEMEESKLSMPLKQTVTDRGITITAEQSITDSYHTLIVFRIEGYELEPRTALWFGEQKVAVNGKYGQGHDGAPKTEGAEFHYWWNLYDGIPRDKSGSIIDIPAEGSLWDITNYTMEDGSIEYHLILSGATQKNYFIDKSVHIQFNDLMTVLDSGEQMQNDVKKTTGKWIFDFNLRGYKDIKKCNINQPLWDSGATIKNIELSPLSVRIDYDFPRQIIAESMDAVDDWDNPIEGPEYKNPPAFIGMQMKDGTVQWAHAPEVNSGYHTEDSNGYTEIFGFYYNIIDVEQVENLLFANPEVFSKLYEDENYEGDVLSIEHYEKVSIN